MLIEQIKDEIQLLEMQVDERKEQNKTDRKKINALKRILKTLDD